MPARVGTRRHRPQPGGPPLRRASARLRSLGRLRALLGPDPAAARQSLTALSVGLLASFVAGFTLGSMAGTLEALPGLLVLIPAAIGMRGTIFGALGSRLATTVHTGTFGISRRVDSVVTQNVLASITLSLTTALALAFLAKGVSVLFGVAHSISLADFVVISMVGGILSSIAVLLLTLGLAATGARRGWDLDNVMAPVVTAAGDMATLPSLYLATFLAGIEVFSPVAAVVLGSGAVLVLTGVLRSGLVLVRRVLYESFPIVMVGGTVQLIAGLTVEQRLEALVRYPALLVLIPPFLASAGALGGILSSRLASKLHLGLIEPAPWPARSARTDLALTFLLALPVFALASVIADTGAALGRFESPGPAAMLAVALLAGFLSTAALAAIAYYGAVAAYRFGLDPDNYGIPVVTSSLDLIGAVVLISVIVTLGLG